MKSRKSDWALRTDRPSLRRLIRHARNYGPQTLTMHGRPVATITAIAPVSQELDGKTGADFIAVMQACPYPEFFDEIERVREERRQFYDRINDLLAKDDNEKRLTLEHENGCSHERL